MDRKTLDHALVKNYVNRYVCLFREYENIKKKLHPSFDKVKDFYKYHRIERKSFLKYYNRFLESWWEESAIFPQKRWPRYKTRRPDLSIESEVIELRKLWNSRYEVYSILKPKLRERTPSPSWIYNIFKRESLNKMTNTMKEEKRKIIKYKLWELWHMDCHYLRRWMVDGDNNKYYLVWLIDDCSRIVDCQLVDNLKSLTVMFSSLKSLNILSEYYWIKFESMLTDNWVEFWTKFSKDKSQYPYERLLMELWIKHKYTKPYRPQTNWKIERFWKTIEEDLFEWTSFSDLEELKDELLKYIYYYNHQRPHWSLWWIPPVDFAKNLLPN